jgi:hypothetical protein
LRVDLILDTDETDAQVFKFLKGTEEVSYAAGKAIKLPHQRGELRNN